MTDVALRTSEDQRQVASHWKMRLTERTEAERTIRAIFDGLVEQESVIEPNGNQVAVREVPMIESLLDYRKSWKIHVPASRSMALRLYFVDKQDNRVTDSIDFANQQAVVVPLATGLNHVTFQFGINEHGEPTETFLEINGREVARLKSLHKELTANSYSNFDFHLQRDYSVDEEIPMLADYRPSPGDTRIRIQLTEEEAK
jgi:hypothetical protein